MNLFPAKIQPYVKAWLTLIGIVVSVVVTTVTAVPVWVTIVGAVATSVAVYLGANATPPARGAHTGVQNKH